MRIPPWLDPFAAQRCPPPPPRSAPPPPRWPDTSFGAKDVSDPIERGAPLPSPNPKPTGVAATSFPSQDPACSPYKYPRAPGPSAPSKLHLLLVDFLVSSRLVSSISCFGIPSI
ncbi:hypothetical protein Purlil1_4269 [Purpureocillium lilacinum]|uniref:Uncharacterized protein n=1 Tax=Purpureocillium lilacinum TaxID=33203 RepID=A0ABR0C518_PURLI|nr:hypothetical protein Purlil1_4269 [Purpureocillium lilacinum]